MDIGHDLLNNSFCVNNIVSIHNNKFKRNLKMSIPQQVTQESKENEELMYKVILNNDLAGLSAIEKVQHVKNVCVSLGLNPLTKPIQLHKWQGKEVMYMAKDGAEQLRNLHNVSIVKLETELLKNDLYVVKAYAMKPNGRQDCSTSALTLLGLKGDAIGNAMKKCETQAKRRVTLSICGLGMLDESELENLPQDKPNYLKAVVHQPIDNTDVNLLVDDIIKEMENCNNMDDLKIVFTNATRNQSLKSERNLINKIIKAKDDKIISLKQAEQQRDEFIAEYDATTGELDNKVIYEATV